MSMMSGRRPTLKDVAKLANVSHQTVSRFVSGDPAIREANRERIQAAIDELGYRPNIVARSMRMRATGLVAAIIPATINPFSPAHVIAALMRRAHELGYQLEVIHVDGGEEARTRRALELADSQLVEGVLSLGTLDLAAVGRRGVSSIPVVEAATYDDHMRGIGVLLDVEPVSEIIDHLAELGHRHFLHVGGPAEHPSANARQARYERAIAARGLISHGITRGAWAGETGIAAINVLADDSPVTAVVCGNDELASGVLYAAQQRGWSVPERLSVTGWDNDRLGRYMPPGMTTVEVDFEFLGYSLFDKLHAALKGEPEPRPDFSTFNTVRWRGSVGPAPTA